MHSKIFIQKFIKNNPQCICQIQSYKWLVIILIYSLPLHFELKNVIEVTYNYMFNFFKTLLSLKGQQRIFYDNFFGKKRLNPLESNSLFNNAPSCLFQYVTHFNVNP